MEGKSKPILLELPPDVVEDLDALKSSLDVSSRSKVVSILIVAAKQLTPAKAQLLFQGVNNAGQ